ncbi:MAG: hypothetical protein R3E31_08895 [Chloroflexota bacterium]
MTENRTWTKKIFYTDKPADDRSRMRAVANNLILHLHPTKVPAPALRWSYAGDWVGCRRHWRCC